jgi:hypothetical protein
MLSGAADSAPQRWRGFGGLPLAARRDLAPGLATVESMLYLSIYF